MRKIPILLVAALVAVPSAAGAQSAQATTARSAAEARAAQQQQPPPPPPVPPSRPRPGQRVTVGRDHDGRVEQRETFTKTVRLAANGVLDVSNLSGNIEIKRGSGAEAVIEVTKIARGRTEEAAREMLPMVRVEITPRPERAEIRTMYDSGEPGRGRNINVSVNYTITAPKETRIRAVTLSGNVTATDIQGELSLVTTSGNVMITNASRVAAARTTSGNVELSNINSDVALEAGTVSGDVIARSVKARRMTVGTVSGRIIIQDVQTERLSAQAFNGDIDFSGALAKGGRYDLKSHSGNVRIAVSEGSGFEVEANSWSGTVHSAFAIGGSDGEPQRGRRKIIRGVVGDGSAVVNITTFSGDVHLVKK